MRVHLLRHGAADDPDALGDPYRVLTPQGRIDVRRTLEALAPTPEAVFTSPLVRAVQTAEIAAQILDRTPRVHPYLTPGASVARALTVLDEGFGSVLLVTHEPTVSAIASFLAGQRESSFRTAELRIYEVDGPESPGRRVG